MLVPYSQGAILGAISPLTECKACQEAKCHLFINITYY